MDLTLYAKGRYTYNNHAVTRANLFKSSLIDDCHCERSEAISIVRKLEIATACKAGLAMTTPQTLYDGAR